MHNDKHHAHWPTPPQALFLDFDGVVVQSVELKEAAYVKIYEGAPPDKLAAILDYQRLHGGVTRRPKFRYYEEHLFGRPATDDRIEELARRYAAIVHEAVVACPAIPGAMDLLERAQGRTTLHVISGTPIGELTDIVVTRRLAPYFASLHGAPETKPQAFARLLSEHGYDPARVVAVGDAPTEYHAARELGIHFMGVVAPGVSSLFPAHVETLPTLEGMARRLGLG